MNVFLPEDLAAIVRQQLETGRFASSAEVIRHALEALAYEEEVLALEREDDPAKLADLRRAWAEGIASGDGGVLDAEAIIAEARARHLAAG